jgi:hypothetical protein
MMEYWVWDVERESARTMQTHHSNTPRLQFLALHTGQTLISNMSN